MVFKKESLYAIIIFMRIIFGCARNLLLSGYRSEPTLQTADDTGSQSKFELSSLCASIFPIVINPTNIQDGTIFPLSILNSKVRVPALSNLFQKTVFPNIFLLELVIAFDLQILVGFQDWV